MKILKKVKIETIEDLINYYPSRYEKRKDITNISDVEIDEINIIKGTVHSKLENIRSNKTIVTKTIVKDCTGVIQVVWFKQPYLKNKIILGDTICLKGKVSNKYNRLSIVSPEIINESLLNLNSFQELTPIYPLTKGLSQNLISKIINIALNHTKSQLKDYLPPKIKKDYELCDYNYAIWQMHNPENEKSFEIARKRIVFDEFLFFQLGLLMLRKENTNIENKYVLKKDALYGKVINSLGFDLTNAQLRVLEEIKADVNSSRTMNRLIQGDVGSGKTIIAVLALVNAVENGYQGAIMAPTEVLAKQHYENIKKTLKDYNINIGLLVGSMTKKQKEEVYSNLVDNKINILVGTHAIIQDKVEFSNLAMVITDEQHRFGVKQRETLVNKGMTPHVLVMSATPIPRTLALIVYGDMDVSIIDEMPPGRQVIKTYSVNTGYRDRIYEFIKKEISNKRQCYIICPTIDDSEENDLEAVTEYTKKIKEKFSEEVNIEYLHGKMKNSEKNMIMDKFVNGDIDILVSTTVVEVGVNVVNASVMVIENADRFGLAQLHQLRGRVGRGKAQSYCILITDLKNELTKKRLKTLEKYNDGFVIAEYDLKLRGPGDAFGIRQHGLPEFKVGNIFSDAKILKDTNKLAKTIVSQNDFIDKEENKYLIRKVDKMLKSLSDKVNL